MKITETTWLKYINRLSHLNNTAGDKMAEYIKKHGTEDTGSLIAYAQALVQKYGEGSAELACQMYDATAEASGVALPPAEPAAPAGYRETAGMIRDTLQSPLRMQAGVSRLVKRAGADTTLKNALRDGAEWAWVPHGDTCAFCITLASRGWQRASKKALKSGHAEHIHAHCDCEYAIRFDSSTTVAGYDPDKYLDQYEKSGGDINAMRREHYAQHRDEINAQKRAAYAAKHPRKEIENTRTVRKKTNKSDTRRPESGIINIRKGADKNVAFHSLADPLVEAMGPGEISHPAEINRFKSEIRSCGARLIETAEEKLAYAPGISRGEPGTVYVSKGASYGAWCHEMQHMIDDRDAGWSGMRILMDQQERYLREKKAYALEIEIAMSIHRPDLAEILKNNLELERREIYGK